MISWIKSEIQNDSNEIRYSKKEEFTDEIVNNFLAKDIDLNQTVFDEKLLKNPYFLNN